MRHRVHRTLIALFVALVLMAVSTTPTLAADIRGGSNVTIGQGQTVADDLYISGGTVEVDGNVDGDLLVSGGTVNVKGTISRDLMVAGGTVTVSGKVLDSIRIAGGTGTITGPVGQDVVLVGGTLDVAPTATIARDLVAAGGTLTMAGEVGRRLMVAADTVVLRGKVTGDVQTTVTNLRLEDGATVGGNLLYTSNNQAFIAPGARINGKVQRTLPEGHEVTVAERVGNSVIAWLRGLVGLLALGLLLVLVFPGMSRRTTEVVTASPWASLGIGAALLIGVPIVALIIFVIGLIVGGWWLGVAAIALYAIALAVAYVLAALFVGRRGIELLVHRAVHPLLALLVGLVALTLVGLIPIVGGVVTLAALLFGLGALTLTLAHIRRPTQPAGPTLT